MTIDIVSLTERDIAKTIDHSLLRLELDDRFAEDCCRLAVEFHATRSRSRRPARLWPTDAEKGSATSRRIARQQRPGGTER